MAEPTLLQQARERMHRRATRSGGLELYAVLLGEAVELILQYLEHEADTPLRDRVAELEAMSEAHGHNIATLFADLDAYLEHRMAKPAQVPSASTLQRYTGAVRLRGSFAGETLHMGDIDGAECEIGYAAAPAPTLTALPKAAQVPGEQQVNELIRDASAHVVNVAIKTEGPIVPRCAICGLGKSVHMEGASPRVKHIFDPETPDEPKCEPHTVDMHKFTLCPGQNVRLPDGRFVQNMSTTVIWLDVADGAVRAGVDAPAVPAGDLDLDLDALQRLCDAATRERYASFCEWWSDEKAQSEEAILAARELAERFRRGEVQHA
jgi:hypothetical protein